MGGWVSVVFETILNDLLYNFRAVFNIALTPVTYVNFIIEYASYIRYYICDLLLSAISSRKVFFFALTNAYRVTLEMFEEMYLPRRHESAIFIPI